MGIHPVIWQHAVCSLTRRKADTSVTPVQTTIIAISNKPFSFFFFPLSKLDTVKAVDYARDVLPICQVICKRLGSVRTLLLPTAASNGVYHYCCPGQSYQYLNPIPHLTISEWTWNPLLGRAVMSR